MSIQDQLSSSTRKRILLWGSLLLGALFLFCILIVVIAPKVINRDSFRSRIEAVISGNLGGSVSYDRLELVLFPQPELAFSNLKIDIPRTGSVSADTVDIYAKLIPLLLGRFEASSVTLDRLALDLNLPGAAAKSRKPLSRKAEPSARSLDDILAFAAAAMPDLSLKLNQGRLSFARDGQPALSLKDIDAVLAFAPEPQDGRERSGKPSDRHYRITGKAQCTASRIAELPGPLKLSVKRFDVISDHLSFSKSRAQLLDSDVSFDGSISGHLSDAPQPDITFRGAVGQDTIMWLRSLAGVPDDLAIHAPITVTKARLRTSGTGTGRSQSLTGSLSVQGGTTITLDLRNENDRFSIEHLQVKDQESDATLRLIATAAGKDLSFTGNLTGNTVDRLADIKRIRLGWIKGDLRVRLPDGGTTDASAEGTLEGDKIALPSVLRGNFMIDRFTARTDGRTILLQPAVLSLGSDVLTMQGAVSFSDSGVALDLDVDADRISLRSLQELVKRDEVEGADARASAPENQLLIAGELRLRAAALIVERYTFDDLSMVLTFGKDGTSMEVPQASICGIGLDGTLVIEDRIVDLTARAAVRGGSLENSIRCILQEEAGFTGPYDLSGTFTGSGTWETLLRSLQGDFELSSKQGRIHSRRIVKGIITYLNSTSMFKGSRSDLLENGFAYDAIAFRGSLKEGVLNLSEGTIRSKEVHITSDGYVDLRNGTLALNVLAAPFTSLDRLLGKIPIIKYLAGNALIVVPARVEGTFSDPKVTPLAISGVGTNITNLMKNVVQAPVKIVDPSSSHDRQQ